MTQILASIPLSFRIRTEGGLIDEYKHSFAVYRPTLKPVNANPKYS